MGVGIKGETEVAVVGGVVEGPGHGPQEPQGEHRAAMRGMEPVQILNQSRQ